VIRSDRERAAHAFDSQGLIAALMGDHPEQIQRVRLTRLGFKETTAYLRSFLKIAIAITLDRARHCLSIRVRRLHRIVYFSSRKLPANNASIPEE
jgi:hypothetical protein